MAFRLLIVDDSPAMRAFIRRVIDISGFPAEACLEAGNGREALEILRQSWVDVILTDINMPEMNGKELLRIIEEDDVLRGIPVLVVSTDATRQRMAQMRAMGARGYLSKPFSPEQLREQLDEMLGVSS